MHVLYFYLPIWTFLFVYFTVLTYHLFREDNLKDDTTIKIFWKRFQWGVSGLMAVFCFSVVVYMIMTKYRVKLQWGKDYDLFKKNQAERVKTDVNRIMTGGLAKMTQYFKDEIIKL